MITRIPRGTKRFTAIAAAVAVIGSTFAISGGASATVGVTGDRIGGENRWDTAALVSEELDDCEVFIANGLNFPDGLAAGSSGYATLLTAQDALPAETLDELNRLGQPGLSGAADTTECGSAGLDINVVGGVAAISSEVFDQLGTFTTDGFIQRLGGANRYATALEVADYWWCAAGTGSTTDTVVISTGLNFPDALAAGPLAAEEGPLLLNDGDVIRPDVGAYLIGCAVENAYIVGGNAAVPASVETDLENEYGINVTRLSGANRSATAVAIADEIVDEIDSDYDEGVLLVNGNTFADALAAGPLGYTWEYPVLLVNENSIPAETAAYHVANSPTIDEVWAIGGTGVISKAVLDGAVSAAKPVATTITSATLATSDVKLGSFEINGDATLKVTADSGTPAAGPGVNAWSIEYVETGVLGNDTVKVLTKTTDCTPACTGPLPYFEVSVASLPGLTYTTIVGIWNGSPAAALTTASTTSGTSTLGVVPATQGITIPGSWDQTVVATFDQKILDPLALSAATGVYDSSNAAANQLLSATTSTNTFDAVAMNKVTMVWNDIVSPLEIVAVGNDEVRMATGDITTITSITNTTGPIVKRLTAAS